MNRATRPLKILQVISSDAASGAERHCVDISIGLRDKGHFVQTAAPAGSWLVRELRDASIPVIELDFRANKGFRAIQGLAQAARRERHDVIHSHLSRAATTSWAASILSGVPLAASVHIRTKTPIYRLVSRRGWVIAVSSFIRGVLLQAGCRQDRTIAVPNGTDFAERIVPSGPAFREDICVPKDAVLAGLIGRVAREKGQHLAVEALGILAHSSPRLHLALVGRISQEEFASGLRRRISELDLQGRVHLTGPRSDIPRVLDSLDFSILPSEMEACPLSALESMARGRPVVATRVGGLPEMVPDGEVGFLVDLTPQSLAEGMSKLAAFPDLNERLGRNARQWVADRYSKDRMLDGLVEVYRRAAKP